MLAELGAVVGGDGMQVFLNGDSKPVKAAVTVAASLLGTIANRLKRVRRSVTVTT